jgi:hypothetical protein
MKHPVAIGANDSQILKASLNLTETIGQRH